MDSNNLGKIMSSWKKEMFHYIKVYELELLEFEPEPYSPYRFTLLVAKMGNFRENVSKFWKITLVPWGEPS